MTTFFSALEFEVDGDRPEGLTTNQLSLKILVLEILFLLDGLSLTTLEIFKKLSALKGYKFNTLLYALVGPIKCRLGKYRTVEECGKWNSTIIDDLRSDCMFDDAANKVHEAAIQTQFQSPPTMDFGGEICGLDLEIGLRMSIRFELSYLYSSPDYFESPAEFTLSLDPKDHRIGIAEYCCGIKDRSGEFSMNKHAIFPTDPSQWIVVRKHRFGENGLNHRLNRDRAR